MTARTTLATARRVLLQLRHDPRTVGLLLVVPLVLMALLWWVYRDNPVVFDRIGPALLGVFPFVVMFLVTSVATLRERTSGTLERLLTMPVGKGDLVVGYGLAFGLLAIVQAVLASILVLGPLGLHLAGSAVLLVVVAVLDALLGMALGLAVSALAATEFQAVQFMPALVLPQFLLCGLLQPRDQLPQVLSLVSDVLPLSYAVDAMQALTRTADAGGVTNGVVRDLLVVGACVAAALALGAATLPRRTP
ncbi:MAG: ABC transporter permease [Actinomycetales bacterium]